MAANLGEIVLIFALLSSFLQFYAPLNKSFSGRSLILQKFSAKILLISLLTAFSCLIYSYIISDFSLANVYRNSHSFKPLLYKITGSWGNHEGSMLLFALIICGYNFFYSELGRSEEKKIILCVQGAICFGIVSYVVFTSNPFERLFPVPETGLGLNPLLQDIGLAMHPPMLYLGYGGFSLAFSFSVAGLWVKKIDKNWARDLRPWVLISWSFLTMGIGLGSWWAYRELGWGGFWFWDPVENSSLMPWLVATSLLHSLVVLEKRQEFPAWASFLAILTFCVGLVGFFLVRSGVLTSVHSFASDPYRGIFMLILLAILFGFALTLYSLRASSLKAGGNFAFVSREGGILLNNVLLLTLCGTILLGTLYPIFLEVLVGERVSVGKPYFNVIFTPVAFLLLFLGAIGPYLKWKKDDLAKLSKKRAIPLLIPLLFFIAAFAGIWWAKGGFTLYAPALGLAFWLLTAIIADISDRIKLFSTSIKKSINKLKDLPLSYYAMVFAHIGVALLAISITLLSAFEEDKELLMKAGEKTELAGYEITFLESKLGQKEDYLARTGKFSVSRNGKELAILLPESRIYIVQGSSTTEADIYYTPITDIYIVIGDKAYETREGKEGFSVRIYVRPFMNLVWLSCLIIAAGGFIALTENIKNRGKKKKK